VKRLDLFRIAPECVTPKWGKQRIMVVFLVRARFGVAGVDFGDIDISW
jgi:hypothetical protein